MSELKGLTVSQVMKMCDEIDETLNSVGDINKICDGEGAAFVGKSTLEHLVYYTKSYKNILLGGEVKL